MSFEREVVGGRRQRARPGKRVAKMPVVLYGIVTNPKSQFVRCGSGG